MKKPVRIVLKVVLWAVVALVALILLLPVWIGPVVKGVANSVTPGIVGTDFRLGQFGLNPYSGCLHVGDLQLANPTNVANGNAVELGSLDVNVAMTTVLSKKIRIEEIVLDGLKVYATANGGNFKQIAENAAGGQKAPEVETGKPAAPAEEKPVEKPAEEGPKVQIDRLVLRNVTVKYGLLPIPVPTIELKDIGADKEEGASLADVWQAIVNTVLKASGAVTDFGKGLFNTTTDAAGATVQAVGDAAGKTVETVGNVAGATAEAVSGAAGKTAEAVGNAAGKAVDAVGNAAGALKGLFK